MPTRAVTCGVLPVVRCGNGRWKGRRTQREARAVGKGRAVTRAGDARGWSVAQFETRRGAWRVAAAAATEGRDDGAVLLFGATGNVGRCVLTQLLEEGRPVVAAVRAAAKLRDMGFAAEGMNVVDGVDMMKPETLTAELFAGVQQVVICTGPRLNDSDLFASDAATFAVDSIGVLNVLAAAERYLSPEAQRTELNTVVLTPEMTWAGMSFGASTSQISPAEKGICMEGTLEEGERSRDARPQGTMQWTADRALDLTGADGISFSVKGDGHTHFILLQNETSGSEAQDFFAAAFDTVNGQWTDVKIPLHEFRLSRQGVLDQTATLTPSLTTKLGWMSSTKTLDGFPARNSSAGAFSFSVESISTYRAARPQLLLLSSGAVERSARIGESMEQRAKDIPIVRLNPGGVLNHKYEAANAVRCSFLPYTILCPTQLIPDKFETDDLKPDLIEFSQGDTISGRLRCAEVAEVILQCLRRPEAVSKTFQVRRSLGNEAKDKAMTDAHYLRQFLTLHDDEDRSKVGLPPFPEPVPQDVPSWSGGRRNERPDTATMESVEQRRNVLHARRDKELLPQDP